MTAKPDNHMMNIQQHLSTQTNSVQSLCHGLELPNEKDFEIILMSATCDRRKEVEKFIQKSYAKNFNASLNSFFPIIITVIRKSDDVIISALGLRYAKETELFSESYLQKSIESEISMVENCEVNRDKIIELGNFVVRDRSDIKVVMPVIAVFIKSINVDWLVYTLTRPIKMFFSIFDLELCHLSDAHQNSVNNAADDWGNYYKYKPAVYYTSVSRNCNKI